MLEVEVEVEVELQVEVVLSLSLSLSLSLTSTFSLSYPPRVSNLSHRPKYVQEEDSQPLKRCDGRVTS